MVAALSIYVIVVLWVRQHPSAADEESAPDFFGEFTFLALAETGRFWLTALSPAALLVRRWQRNMYNHKGTQITKFAVRSFADKTRDKGGPRKTNKLDGQEDSAAEKARLRTKTQTWLNDEIPLCGTFFVASDITDTSEVGAAIERTMSAV